MKNFSLAGAALLAAALLTANGAGARTLIPQYTAGELRAACDAALIRGKSDVDKLARLPLAKATVANTLNAWNDAQIRIENVSGPADIFANVSPDDKVRAAGDECTLKVTSFNTEVFQNEALYRRFKAVKPATGPQRHLLKIILENFEDNGVALPADKRARVREIFARLESLRQEFDKNVREDRTKVVFSAEEMKGLPQSYLDKAPRDDKGNYTLSFDYPEYLPFMNLADSEDARKRYYIAFINRAGEGNLRILNEIEQLRLELAKLYGLPSYAHYVIRRRMAESPEAVNAFLQDVKDKVYSIETKDVAELRGVKAQSLKKKPEDVSFNAWDVRYYEEKLRNERFNIDQEALRKYFPMPAAIDYTLYVSSKLYGVKFKRVDVPVWHKDVVYYDVLDGATGKYMSGFYLDLYPRDGKYKHAAASAVRSASRVAGRTPVSLMMANLNREGLNHDELETLMHEFGHVLNNVLSVTDYAGQSFAQWDFVEAPSQMYEEWARKPESLALFQKVCENCPALDADLVKRLNDARKFGRGLWYARQYRQAAFDMSLTSEAPGDALEVWKKIEAEGILGYIDGTMFPANFSHIVNSGYGAGYYGYMWSEVLALDMLSAYGDNLLDAKVGRRFRDDILAQGGQMPARELVRRFLGREPDKEAFFAEITGQR